MPRKKEVTLKHIAARLGLTVHTVSKALRGLPGMSESTRREVFRTARSMGYWSKSLADGLAAERIPLASGKPRRFMLIMPNDGPFYRLQSDGLERRLHELGHVVQAVVLPQGCTDEAKLSDWAERSGLLLQDGLFLTPALAGWTESALLDVPLPKVMINFPPAQAAVDSVIWDVQHAVHLALETLCRHGHRRILYVGDTGVFRGFKLRWEAFVAASVRLGLTVPDPDDHLISGANNRVRWVERIRDKLGSGAYTAVLAAVPGEAEWIQGAASSLGITIPGELSLIGIEDEALRHFPDLTRPSLLVNEAGERAAELMLRRIANPLAPFEHVRLLGPMVEGATVGPV